MKFQKVGYLTVIKKVRSNTWLCVCKCGSAETRKSKTINNPCDYDCCNNCKEKAYKIKHFQYISGNPDQPTKHYIKQVMSKY